MGPLSFEMRVDLSESFTKLMTVQGQKYLRVDPARQETFVGLISFNGLSCAAPVTF